MRVVTLQVDMGNPLRKAAFTNKNSKNRNIEEMS